MHIFSLKLPCALKSCSHYVQNYYSLKEIVTLEQVGEPGLPLEPNSRYATGTGYFPQNSAYLLSNK